MFYLIEVLSEVGGQKANVHVVSASNDDEAIVKAFLKDGGCDPNDAVAESAPLAAMYCKIIATAPDFLL